jgi:branched-chain amino acid transport system substrate-binding protein
MIENQHFKWVAAYFFTTSIAAKVPFEIWNSLPEADKIKRPAMIMTDNLGGQSFGKAFREWAKQFGYTFVVDEAYPVGTKDFSSLALKMKVANADALLILAGPADAITFVRQMKDAQLKLRFVEGWAGFWPAEFVKALGKDADYILHDGFWTENNGKPGSKDLGQRFRKQFGKDSTTAGHHYANVQILAQAIEKAGSLDSAKVRDAVFGGEFKDTLIGDVKFDAKGLAATTNNALQWWKGERMPVYPPVPSMWKLKMMPVD